MIDTNTINKIAAGGFILAIVSSILIILIRLTPEPDLEKIINARKALSMARREISDSFISLEDFKAAEIWYDSALTHWQLENEKWIFSRNFSKVEIYADSAEKSAILAMIKSRKEENNLRVLLPVAFDSMESMIAENKHIWQKFAVSVEEKSGLENALMLLSDARMKYENSELHKSRIKLSMAREKLEIFLNKKNPEIEAYFRQLPDWKEMVENTINNSKFSKSIVIDKTAAKCYLYNHGRNVTFFDAELGINWFGNKRFQGDKATPEGEYRVIRKKSAQETNYHKALLLNYPNSRDHLRFRSELAMGSLPAGSRIGGLIEIHGGGGRGLHWTDGCIALTDEDMDLIFEFAEENTPVIIVGSLKNLEELKESMQ